MAHYIAEKMTAAASARGKTKASAQRDCFEAILILWDHQASFPNDIRPFKDFEPVFRAMAHIDPNKDFPSYFSQKNGSDKPPTDTEQYANFVVNLDSAIRTMMSYFLRKAILSTTDEATLGWLHGIKDVSESSEAKVILNFVPELDVTKDNDEQAVLERRIKELSEHIERLQSFEHVSKFIRLSMESELKNLKKS